MARYGLKLVQNGSENTSRKPFRQLPGQFFTNEIKAGQKTQESKKEEDTPADAPVDVPIDTPINQVTYNNSSNNNKE